MSFLELRGNFALIFSYSVLSLVLQHVFFDTGDVIAGLKGGNVEFIIIIERLVKIQRGVHIDTLLFFRGFGNFS